jgi:energy-coupling factor transporter ATP-binding protein EcfA2
VSTEIKIENVGPIESLSIPVPANGGVVVLRGRNGSGKSTALRAVDSVTRLHRVDESPRDGENAGEIQCLGVTVRVGRRVTSSGALSVERVEDDVQPHQVVDPGIREPERREAARIRGLLRLAGVTASPEQFQVYSGVRIDFPAGQSDAVDLASHAKKELQKLAREEEARASVYETQAEALRILGVTPHPDAMPFDVAKNNLTDCAAAVGRVRQRLDAYNRSQSLGSLEVLDENVRNARQSQQSASDDLARLTAEVADATSRLAMLKSQAESASLRLRDAKHSCSQAERALDAVQSMAGVTPTTQDDLDEVVGQMQAAQEAFDLAKGSQEADERRVSYRAIVGDAEGHRAVAEQLRTASVNSIEDVLTSLINGVGAGVSIRNGRLCVRTDRSEHEPFDDLSHAERWLTVLRMLVVRVGQRSVVAIPQEVWEGMDSGTRDAVHAAALATQTVLLTAEADDSELRAEPVGGGDIWTA